MHLIDRKTIPMWFGKSYYNDKWLKPFYFVEILHIGSGLNPSLCVFKWECLIHFNGLHFDNINYTQINTDVVREIVLQ
jgi:hypothetical protein